MDLQTMHVLGAVMLTAVPLLLMLWAAIRWDC